MHVPKMISRMLISACCLAVLFSLPACQKDAGKDYSAEEPYRAVFTEEDDARTKDLKNVLCEHIEAYNTGDAELYFSLFDMDKKDISYNISTFDSLRMTSKPTDLPESITTAFIDDNNAQVCITMIRSAVSLADETLLYKYRTDLTYTMVRTGKDWKVTLQTPGFEEDLMYEEETAEETASAS